jgi:hypothetical protein
VVIGGIVIDEPDDDPDLVHARSEGHQGETVVSDEPLAAQKLTRRIAGQTELGKHHKVGTATECLVHEAPAASAVARQVARGRVDLRERDLHGPMLPPNEPEFNGGDAGGVGVKRPEDAKQGREAGRASDAPLRPPMPAGRRANMKCTPR